MNSETDIRNWHCPGTWQWMKQWTTTTRTPKTLMSSKSNVVHHQTISKEIKQKVHKMISEKQSKQEKDNDYTNAYANKTAAVLVTRKLRSASVPKPPLQPVPDEDDNTAVPLVVDITDKEDTGWSSNAIPLPKYPQKRGAPPTTRATTKTQEHQQQQQQQWHQRELKSGWHLSKCQCWYQHPANLTRSWTCCNWCHPAKTESMLQLLNANEESSEPATQ